MSDDDKTPVDEIKVIDDHAESLAVDGPPDDANEHTPTLKVCHKHDVCPECRGGANGLQLVRFVDEVPPPRDLEAAWELDTSQCYSGYSEVSGFWLWCPRAAVLVIRRSWERRSKPRTEVDRTVTGVSFLRKPSA